MIDPSTRLAAVLHDQRRAAEELLAAFAARLKAAGADVGGLIQKSGREPNGASRMELIDIRTGQSYLISQNLGPGSDSCCVSPAGLTEASAVLRREIAHRPALLIINKFAGQEAEGEGLAPEMFEAVAEGIPVLTAVSQRYQERWQQLTEGASAMLAPTEEALWSWWETVVSRGSGEGAR